MKTLIATAITTLALSSSFATADVEMCQYGFDNQEDALHSALNRANPSSISGNQLVIGSIYKLDGRYYATYSAMESGKSGGEVSLMQPSQAQTVALFRTSGDSDEQLNGLNASNADRRAIKKHGVDYFVADATGDLFIVNMNSSRYRKVIDDSSEKAIASHDDAPTIEPSTIVAVITSDECMS